MTPNELTTHQVDAALSVLTHRVGTPELQASAERLLIQLFQIPVKPPPEKPPKKGK